MNLFYASSNHVAALAGGSVLAAILLTPWAAILALSVIALAWSRVELKAHTAPQALAGAALGAVSTFIVVSLVS